jgi:hypothetical protein
VQGERLKGLVDALQEDVVVREEDVLKLEQAASEHQKKIDEANAHRAALEKRRQAAED